MASVNAPSREHDMALSERVTRLEVMMENLGRQIGRELEVASNIHASVDRSLAVLTELAEKHYQRITSLEKVFWKASGAVAVALLLVTLVAPVLRDLLRLPS